MPTAATQRRTANIPQTGVAARLAIRNGEWGGPTSGMAPGYVQGNLAILPAKLASDFLRFCQLNPKPGAMPDVGAVQVPLRIASRASRPVCGIVGAFWAAATDIAAPWDFFDS